MAPFTTAAVQASPDDIPRMNLAGDSTTHVLKSAYQPLISGSETYNRFIDTERCSLVVLLYCSPRSRFLKVLWTSAKNQNATQIGPSDRLLAPEQAKGPTLPCLAARRCRFLVDLKLQNIFLCVTTNTGFIVGTHHMRPTAI